ncbi:MAG: phosphate/phosphite/phosphonate ABC transporter substrate-binding protein [Sulfurimonadaceae bacterium]|nr:phosphate/phosphite/phosphonate ABC transporter substrate-binding protein [Sulfurimonadaceae bacterium]
MHNIRRIIIGIIVAFTLAGCNGRDDTQTYRPEGTAVEQKTYIVGIHPYLNTKKMYLSYRPIFDYIESKIEGVRFELETSKDYPSYDKKLYKRRFHFALPNPFQTVNSFQHGYIPIARMKPDTVFRGIFVARKDTKLTSVSQLKGNKVSFPAPTALAATMMPLYYLHMHGLDTKNDITKKFVGSQYSSIMNAYSGDTVAGATWPPPWEQWCKENPDKAEQMELVWETEPLVYNGFTVRDDVDMELARRLADVLVGLDEEPHSKLLLDDAGFAGFVSADAASFQPVLDFLRDYDKAIGLPK